MAKKKIISQKVVWNTFAKWRRRILSWKGVVHVGVGCKEKGGQSTFDSDRDYQWCIRIFVEQKLGADELKRGRRKHIPPTLDGVPTDVIVVKTVSGNLTANGAGPAPCTGDVSVMLHSQMPIVTSGKPAGGTLCSTAKSNGVDCFLTCQHVAFSYKPGTGWITIPGDTLMQPASPAGAVIGTPFKKGFKGGFDAASVRASGGASPDTSAPRVDLIWEPAVAIENHPAVTMQGVGTCAATGKLASGTIQDFNAPPVDFPPFGRLQFLMSIKGDNGKFALPGDSGAMIVHTKADGTKVGMAMIAGVGVDGLSYATPLYLIAGRGVLDLSEIAGAAT